MFFFQYHMYTCVIFIEIYWKVTSKGTSKDDSNKKYSIRYN